MNDGNEFDSKQVVLIVDDTPDNITLLSALLKDNYKIKIATNGVKALHIASTLPSPDLILLDVMMPTPVTTPALADMVEGAKAGNGAVSSWSLDAGSRKVVKIVFDGKRSKKVSGFGFDNFRHGISCK